MTSEPSNRRLAPRHPARIRVLFRRHGVAHYLEAETENLSLDGAFVRTDRRPLEVGTRLLVILSGEGIETELSFLGTVTWNRTEPQGDDEPRGMGIRFDGLSDEQRAEIEKTLARVKGSAEETRALDSSPTGEF